MIQHAEIPDEAIRNKIRSKKILYGGNNNLKIYGALSCTSGKRMKRANRVFFSSEQEAVANGFRPCGHCLKAAYKKWKHAIV